MVWLYEIGISNYKQLYFSYLLNNFLYSTFISLLTPSPSSTFPPHSLSLLPLSLFLQLLVHFIFYLLIIMLLKCLLHLLYEFLR